MCPLNFPLKFCDSKPLTLRFISKQSFQLVQSDNDGNQIFYAALLIPILMGVITNGSSCNDRMSTAALLATKPKIVNADKGEKKEAILRHPQPKVEAQTVEKERNSPRDAAKHGLPQDR